MHCINIDCHYYDPLYEDNCSKPGLEGDMLHTYFPHCEWRITNKAEEKEKSNKELE